MLSAKRDMHTESPFFIKQEAAQAIPPGIQLTGLIVSVLMITTGYAECKD
jgi:hypothetical protein